jgi:hypothetical protein
MKNILIIFLVFFANNAMASKARLEALNMTTDLTGLGFSHDGNLLFKDNRNIFLNPAQIGSMGNQLNFEMGNSTVANTPNAEGGFIYDWNNGKLGVQLGRQSDVTRTISKYVTPLGVVTPKDSFDVIWGQKGNTGWGAGLHYASTVNDPSGATSKKGSELILSGGMVQSAAEYYAQLAVMASSENNTGANPPGKWDGKTYIKVGGAWTLDNTTKVIGQIFNNGYNYNAAGGAVTEIKSLLIDVRYNKVHKPKTDVTFFYGAGFTNVTGDASSGGTKNDITVQQVPLFFGLESAATSWMDVRASVTQGVLLNSQKNVSLPTVADTQSDPNSTTLGAGTTLKFTNFILDATLAAASTGDINSAALLSHASILYYF